MHTQLPPNSLTQRQIHVKAKNHPPKPEAARITSKPKTTPQNQRLPGFFGKRIVVCHAEQSEASGPRIKRLLRNETDSLINARIIRYRLDTIPPPRQKITKEGPNRNKSVTSVL